MGKHEACRICSAPINVESHRRHRDVHIGQLSADARGGFELLKKTCINCYADVARIYQKLLEEEMLKQPERRRAWRWQREEKPAEQFARAIARHLTDVLKTEVHKRRRRSLTLYPPESDERRVVLLDLCARLAGFTAKTSRCLSDDVGQRRGIEILWRPAAHYRHLRKSLGIKGMICKFADPNPPSCGHRIGIQRAFTDYIEVKDGVARAIESIQKRHPLWFKAPWWVERVRNTFFKEYAPPDWKLDVYRETFGRPHRSIERLPFL